MNSMHWEDGINWRNVAAKYKYCDYTILFIVYFVKTNCQDDAITQLKCY